MTFFWPPMLWLLATVPVLVLAYLLLLRRRKKAAVRYASLSLVKEAMAAGMGWRRHVPAALVLLAWALLAVGMARPAALVTLAAQRDTVILAMDVSGSMRATDVTPDRITASQEAAKAFVANQPRTTRIGMVAFAGTAMVVQQPTLDRADVLAAIDRFQLQRGTAIGSGIIVSLATIFPDAGISVSESIYGGTAGRPLSLHPEPREPKEFEPVPPGSYASAAIILLTDGQRTTGPDPLQAARMAADRGVRVFAVGVGTPQGDVIGFEGWSFLARLDEDTLKAIADLTRGEYFHAGTAMDLKKVYQSLNARLVFEKTQTEITALFAAAAAGLSVLAAFLSLLWFHRIL
jgi:Ca-activated chloride channel homolog